MPPPEAGADAFTQQRPRLLRLAYRMLGSSAEAEDILQEAWIRWQGADQDGVRSAPAFLTRVVTRLCLDQLGSARARRESYVGSWLPEPLYEPEPEEMRADEITLTLMLALERLSPLERAAFLLHDVFEVPLPEVATALGRDPAAARQLAARARAHVKEARPRYAVAPAEGERIAAAFFQASTTGDLEALRGLLAEGVVLQSDGGGKVTAFLNPILGLEKALRLFAGLARKPHDRPAELLRACRIDGLPGYVSRGRDGLLQTTALAIEDGRITAIYITRNPEKLRQVAAALAATAPPDGLPS
ncbi:sigma-70 family RNA polymerase sigma factor [Roseomonas sp. 18066]|uniref:sigma-70 family RNA polymerase sigma factor n=1 Tax=Roseomonas sp. 18066 TaxID=2681412 RepID=UPI001356DC8D|nr:sigma-70 family RNA polymerase sigma factor [Roseomonas sp. 18066]